LTVSGSRAIIFYR